VIRRFLRPPELDRWEDYLDQGETLLWQGAPEPGPHSILPTLFLSIFGVPFLLAGLTTAGFGLSHLFGLAGGFGFGGIALGLFLLAFSVPFLGVGGGLVLGTWFYSFNMHKFIRYALSNRRAYVAKSFLRHSLESYPIGPDATITLIQGKYDTVNFHTEHGRDSDGDKTTTKVGFEHIADGPEVYRLIRNIQKGIA
jgi:hypothetical protein